MKDFQSSFFALSEDQGAVVARLSRPQLTEQDNLEQFEQELTTLVETYGVRKLILNLERLNYVTSHAIGKFISLHKRMQRAEGTLVMCSAGDEVRQILENTHLWTYFNMANTTADAGILLA